MFVTPEDVVLRLYHHGLWSLKSLELKGKIKTVGYIEAIDIDGHTVKIHIYIHNDVKIMEILENAMINFNSILRERANAHYHSRTAGRKSNR